MLDHRARVCPLSHLETYGLYRWAGPRSDVKAWEAMASSNRKRSSVVASKPQTRRFILTKALRQPSVSRLPQSLLSGFCPVRVRGACRNSCWISNDEKKLPNDKINDVRVRFCTIVHLGLLNHADVEGLCGVRVRHRRSDIAVVIISEDDFEYQVRNVVHDPRARKIKFHVRTRWTAGRA